MPSGTGSWRATCRPAADSSEEAVKAVKNEARISEQFRVAGELDHFGVAEGMLAIQNDVSMG